MAGDTQSLRKYLGAIKDTTTVSLAKLTSDYKDLEIAIVNATNHVESPAKEKYIKEIFQCISATRPRADVAYCIHALSRRLTKTRNWAVALKTLIVIHRALREADRTFREELINYGRTRGHMLNLAYFKDDSSSEAWDYSAWVRNYALFLEEKLECFRVLKYDVETDPLKIRDLDTIDLLDQLPALQELLGRLLGCQPQGAAAYNVIIQHALSMVALESVKIYSAISDGTINMVDKFFEMKRNDAIRALDIYKYANNQAGRLSEFYEVCKTIHIGRGEKFLKIEQPPASFLQTMEEYVSSPPNTVLAIEYKKTSEVEEAASVSAPAPAPAPEPEPEPELEPTPAPEPVKEEAPVTEPTDLLGMNNSSPVATELDQKNALALAIVPLAAAAPAAGSSSENGANGWELALVTAPNSNETAIASSKLAGGFDMLTLDSLYEEAHRRANQTTSYNPWEAAPATSGPFMQPAMHDPFYASNAIAGPHNVQMAAMAQQQQAFMQQQQQHMMMMPQQHMMMMPQQHMMMGPQQPQQVPLNPYANPYAAGGVNPYGTGMPLHTANAYTRLI